MALLFLTGGAIVNVAVAWGFSLRGYQPGTGKTWLADDASKAWWHKNSPPGFPESPTTMYESHGFGRWSVTLYETEQLDSDTRFIASRIAQGWPTTSMAWTGWMDLVRRTDQRRSVFEWSGWPCTLGTSWKLPLSPLWPGFAINSIFYAALLWALWITSGKVRRLIRMRRSQCPACGHIIASGTCANGLCSECGAPLPEGFKPKPEASAKS
jgi:hypothetical protein